MTKTKSSRCRNVTAFFCFKKFYTFVYTKKSTYFCPMNTFKNQEESSHFDDFFYDVWDGVSEKVVDDNFWEDNLDLIKEVTFDLYRLREKSGSRFTKRQCSVLLENFFHNILKNGVRIRK